MIALPFGSWYHLICIGFVVPLYITAVVILGTARSILPRSNFEYTFVATRITPVGTCRFDDAISLDHSNESCAKFWYKLQRVQIVAVVLAGIVLCVKLLFSSTILIGSRISVQNYAFCGGRLCYSHADKGTQEQTFSYQYCIAEENHTASHHSMAGPRMVL